MSITERVVPSSGMTHEEAVARARALAPAIGERAAAAEAQRRQPQETIEEIVEAGLVRLLIPARWGGHELSFDAFIDSVIEIAKADGSAGWCYSFLLGHAWLLAYFPEEAQREVWTGNPDALLSPDPPQLYLPCQEFFYTRTLPRRERCINHNINLK